MISRPVIEGLGGAIIAVLERDEEGFMGGADLHLVGIGGGGRAGPLSADVDEDGAGGIVEGDVVDPVALLIGRVICGVKVIDQIGEPLDRNRSINLYTQHLLGISTCGHSQSQ